MSYACISHVYSLVSIGILAPKLKAFVIFYTSVGPFHDMIVRISEYYLMEKYSLLGCRKIILWAIIDRRYIETGNLFCISLFLLLSIYNNNNKKVYKDF